MRLYLTLAFVYLASVVGSFLGGRFTAPDKIVYLPGESSVRVVTVHRNREMIRRIVVQQTDAGTTTTTDEHEKEVERAEPIQPVSTPIGVQPAPPGFRRETNWRAGFLVGAAGIGAPTGTFVTYGAEVERTLFGPFWAGVWGMSSGSVGFSLKVEF